jgi:hypothetical protein
MWGIVMLRCIGMSVIIVLYEIDVFFTRCQVLRSCHSFSFKIFIIFPFVMFFHVPFPLDFKLELIVEPVRIDKSFNYPLLFTINHYWRGCRLNAARDHVLFGLG